MRIGSDELRARADKIDSYYGEVDIVGRSLKPLSWNNEKVVAHAI